GRFQLRRKRGIHRIACAPRKADEQKKNRATYDIPSTPTRKRQAGCAAQRSPGSHVIQAISWLPAHLPLWFDAGLTTRPIVRRPARYVTRSDTELIGLV